MTEAQARQWVAERYGVSRETLLAKYGELLLDESERQNLIARSTAPELWTRHLLDSAQLVELAERHGAGEGVWIDIGSGAGLPGIVVAILGRWPVVLVEPRARRAEFLARAVAALGLSAQVVPSRIETYRPPDPAAVISARAVAALPDLLAAARHCSVRRTLWLLPKGRNAQSEVEAARKAWQGSFHVERSITEADSGIVVAREIRPR